MGQNDTILLLLWKEFNLFIPILCSGQDLDPKTESFIRYLVRIYESAADSFTRCRSHHVNTMFQLAHPKSTKPHWQKPVFAYYVNSLMPTLWQAVIALIEKCFRDRYFFAISSALSLHCLLCRYKNLYTFEISIRFLTQIIVVLLSIYVS